MSRGNALGAIVRRTFQGGMALDISDYAAPTQVVRYVNNMLPFPLGALSTRDGRARLLADLDEETDYSQVYDIYRYVSGTGSFYVYVGQAASTTEIGWVGANPTTPEFVPVATGLTTASPTVGMQVRNRLILANGQDAVKTYVHASSTHTVRNTGVGSGPTIATATPAAGTGTLDSSPAVYDYKLTAIFGPDGETNGGAAKTATMGGGDNEVALAWSAHTAPVGMTLTGYRIWRKRTDSGNDWNGWYLVDEVGAAATSYTDRLDDAKVYASGAGDILHDNHNAPPTGCEGAVWWDYMGVAVYWGDPLARNRLYFSEYLQPEVVKTADDSVNADNLKQYWDVPQEQPQNGVVAVVPFDQYLYVLNQNGARILIPTGSDPPYRAIEIASSAGHGCIAKRAVAVSDTGVVFYASSSGLRAISGNARTGFEDREVAAGDTAGAVEIAARPSPSSVGSTLDNAIRAIPGPMRKFAAMAIHNDLLHVSMARAREYDPTPTVNNDVLIFSLRGGGFVYREDAKINGMAAVNESGSKPLLVSASSEGGMVFMEYVDGQTKDQPANGDYGDMVETNIAWQIEDYHRVLNAYLPVELDNFVLDAVASDESEDAVTILASLWLDGADQISNRQFPYGTGGKRVWSDSAYLEVTPGTTSFGGDPGDWDELTDAQFSITIDGTPYDIDTDLTGIEGSAAAAGLDPMVVLCAVLQGIIRFLTGETIWVGWTGTKIRFTSNTVGATGGVTALTTHSVGGGTDISGSGYLNAASAVEFVPISTTRTALKWASEASGGDEYRWSNVTDGRTKPRMQRFDGQRAYTAKIGLYGDQPATVYGWRLEYELLKTQAYGD